LSLRHAGCPLRRAEDVLGGRPEVAELRLGRADRDREHLRVDAQLAALADDALGVRQVGIGEDDVFTSAASGPSITMWCFSATVLTALVTALEYGPMSRSTLSAVMSFS
jgi:hypothetical protein